MAVPLFTDTVLAKCNSQPRLTISIITEPADVTVPMGVRVTLSAHILVQKPQYQWYNSRGEAIPHANHYELTFDSVTEEDFGFYRLKITEESTRQTVLTRWVELKREISPVNYEDTIIGELCRPKLLEGPAGGLYQRGCSVMLISKFENATHYQWYRNNRKVGMPNSTVDSLTIDNIDVQHEGTYLITASNMNGYGTASAMVNVQVAK